MLFPTMTFAIFFLVVLPVSWRLRPQPFRWKLFVLLASYVFYAAWDWRFCALLAVSTIGNQAAAMAIHRAPSDSGRRRALIAGVVFDLALLGVFKYYGFFVESLVAILRPVGLAPTSLLVKITLPVGISFFTFCGLSYVIDVYRRTLKPASLLDVAVYLSFFPHLVAGPIVRGSEFLPQLRRRPDPDAVDATRGARLVTRGLFKKVVIANFLAQAITDPVFGSPGSYRSWDLLIAAYAYSVQIYADFSGYTDMAIGIALLMGVKFPDNFDRPYTARSIQEFWRRWHMTLSRWLRDYLYIPLGGNRGGRWAEYRNLLVTMVLGGLWHGASWTFVVWGTFHGVGLTGERWANALRDMPRTERSPRVERLRSQLGLETSHGEVADLSEGPGQLGTAVDEVAPAHRRLLSNPWVARVVVFHFVTLGWVFFRSATLSDAWLFIGRLASSWGSTGVVTPMVLLTIVAALAAQVVPSRGGDLIEWRVSYLPPAVLAVGVGLFFLVCNVLGPQGVAPFIYFQF